MRWLELRYRGVEASLCAIPEHDALARCSEALRRRASQTVRLPACRSRAGGGRPARRSPRPFVAPPAPFAACGHAPRHERPPGRGLFRVKSAVRAACSIARSCARRHDRRAGDRLRERVDDGRSIPAGGPRFSPAGNCWSYATHDGPRAHGRFRRGRSGHARNLQQPVRGHRRADGHHAAQHRHSVNVKERLDFSCALFTAEGDLVVNAPHIPVHLGAMGETVPRRSADNPADRCGRRVRHQRSLPRRFALARRHGGHAGPRRPSGELLFFTASRAHHAEIGGITPGSMPPFSRNLAEEGVLIRNFKLVDAGHAALRGVASAAGRGALPDAQRGRQPGRHRGPGGGQPSRSRRPGAAGRALFAALSCRPTCATSRRPPNRKCGRALAKLRPGTARFVDHLDDGTPIAVAITIAGGEATIDFTGTGPVLRGQLERQPRDRHRGGDVRSAGHGRRRHSAQPRRAGAGRRSCCPSAC